MQFPHLANQITHVIVNQTQARQSINRFRFTYLLSRNVFKEWPAQSKLRVNLLVGKLHVSSLPQTTAPFLTKLFRK